MNDKRIWKYQLEATDIQILQIPSGGVILSCQIQKGKPCLWVMVEPELKKTDRFIEIIGTGNPAHETLNVKRIFIDTIQIDGGDLVFHIFERVER